MKLPFLTRRHAGRPDLASRRATSSILSDLAQSWERSGWQLEHRRDDKANDLIAVVARREFEVSKPVRVHFLILLRDSDIEGSGSNQSLFVRLGQWVSRTLVDRAEIQLTAMAKGDSSKSCRRLLPELDQVRAEDGSTLILELDSPGYGPVFLDSRHRELAELASRAAEDLWIPHQTRRRRGWLLCLSRKRNVRRITLSGTPGRPSFDPAIASGAVQLALEIALRWSRKAQDDGVSLARSSQKPG